MDYLKCGGDITKYDGIKSVLVYGRHPEHPVRFSIIVPTYRRVDYLSEAIRSALNQRYREPYEIVIVDNNDSDEEMFNRVFAMVSGFHDERIVYYRNEKNIGIYGNTLRAGQLAKGERLVLLNDDDVLHPMYLQVINGFLEKYHYEGVIGTVPAEFRNDQYEYVCLRSSIHSYSISKAEFFFGCTVTSPGLCVPRQIYEEIYNAYDGILMGDQMLQYKALRKYGLVFVECPLALYRVGSNETKKDSVLRDMVFHMCRFRRQTAEDSLFLRAYCALLWRYYCVWYSNEVVSFWKKHGFKNQALRDLGVSNIPADRFWYQFNAWFIANIRKVFARYRLKHYDAVNRGLDY